MHHEILSPNTNKQLFQKEIVFRFADRGRTDKELPNLPFRATREGIVLSSALNGRNFVLSQNIARMFT